MIKPTVLFITADDIIRHIHSGSQLPDDAASDAQLLANSLASIKRAISENTPTHAALVFDHCSDTWRHVRYPAYKSGKDPVPGTVHRVLRECQLACRVDFNLQSIVLPHVESLDVIATLCKSLENKGIDSVILSTCHDYFQLISQHVSFREHFKRQSLTPQSITKHYNLSPAQMRDYLALVGHPKGHGVPGVPGIGKINAKKLLALYYDVPTIIAQRHLMSNNLSKPIKQNIEMLELSYALATLRTDVDTQGLNLHDLNLSPR